MTVQEQPDPSSTDRIHALAERAAKVQDLLGDLELALLPAGESPPLRLLRELKAAWREFRDEAMRVSPPQLRTMIANENQIRSREESRDAGISVVS